MPTEPVTDEDEEGDEDMQEGSMDEDGDSSSMSPNSKSSRGGPNTKSSRGGGGGGGMGLPTVVPSVRSLLRYFVYVQIYVKNSLSLSLYMYIKRQADMVFSAG